MRPFIHIPYQIEPNISVRRGLKGAMGFVEAAGVVSINISIVTGMNVGYVTGRALAARHEHEAHRQIRSADNIQRRVIVRGNDS